MIEVKENGKVSARDLHKFLESKERFSKWFERMLKFGFSKSDYTPYQKVHPQNNQFFTDYYLSLNMSKELSMLAKNKKGKEARGYFIKIQEQKQNFDTLTHDEVVNLSKRIDVFKYEDNQKEIEKMHKDNFVASGKGSYADFNIRRNDILNIHSDKIDNAIKEYCISNKRKLPNLKSKHDKIQFIDEHKNLKHAIWDSLEIQGNKHSLKLANLGERMAKALGIKTKRKNETNLFAKKEDINVKSLITSAKKASRKYLN
jgi:anti-repressor protein